MDLADPMHLPRIEEDALGGRGLPGIDVSHDADVTEVEERVLPCHVKSLRLYLVSRNPK
jgi:hypothetical protein